jgi:hypothetical protein
MPATAGDGIADFEFKDREVTAAAGETVELELVVDSDGGYASGVGALGATIAVNSEYATITDVEHGRWLEEREGVDVNRTKTISDGRAIVRHERLAGPEDDGVTGRKRFVTVTIDIAPDTPPSKLTVGLPKADAELVRGFGLRTIQHAGTIVVDGGGKTIEPAATTTEPEESGGVGVTTATEVGRNGTNETESDEPMAGDPSGASDTPGFQLVGGLVALLSLVTALAARQHCSEDS